MIRIEKEELKLSLLVNDKVIYIDNPREWTN